MIDLSGRVALVTGASGGIGREIALALDQAGARVCAAGRDVERLTALTARLTHEPLLLETDQALPTAGELVAQALEVTRTHRRARQQRGHHRTQAGRGDHYRVHRAGDLHQPCAARCC